MRLGLSSIVFLLRACTRRVFFAAGYRGAFYFLLRVRGTFVCLLRVRGALFSVLLARGAFFFAAGTRRVFFASGAQCVFSLCCRCAPCFFCCGSQGVWRGLFSTAGAGGGAVGCGSRGVRFYIWAWGGMMGLRRRVHVFAAGARRVCLFFAAAAGGFRVRNSEGGLSYTGSH